MNDDSSFAQLLVAADEYARQLDALEPEFQAIGEVELLVSFDDIREQLCSSDHDHPIPFGAVRA
jgi:hypothetical protein